MKDFQDLVNRTKKKFAGRKKKDVHFVEHLIAGAVSDSSSSPMMDLVDGDCVEEKVAESTKGLFGKTKK